ncbi:hypothetical protein L1987_42407 [Smallanthus sonchifolius]|uniref:Uncharacterized protein n=1 Tax=Smallanthus sonchifolius TaxID=185202 RepID=A0ACB9GII5_9ASTR|nr:hypothetical protein L1987_42407 [Smallanthus sonchifolius]
MDINSLMGFDTPFFHHILNAAAADENTSINKSNNGGPTGAYVRDARAMAATPADVKEHPGSYVFIVDMPGVKSGDIKVHVEEDNVLVISGERKRDHGLEEKEGVKYVRMERRMGKLMRKFALPENADTDKISAICQDGVLTVTVGKVPPPEPKKPKTIQVQCRLAFPCFESIMSTRQDELEAKTKVDEEIAKAAVDTLNSILSQKLEKEKESVKERLTAPETYARVYLRRKLPKDVPSEPPLVIISKDSSQAEVIHKSDLSKSTPRKKSNPKRVLKKPIDVVTPSREKYKRMYETADDKEFTDRDLERMAYLVEHGVKWDEILRMYLSQVEDFVHAIKSKMTKEELERDELIFYLKANNNKNKQLKNMKTEKLKKLVNDIKSKLEKEKRVHLEKELEKEKKEIYSTHTDEASIKVIEESKATWFKKNPESLSRMVDNFEVGLENFSKETLKEKIISWRYDSRKIFISLTEQEIKILTTHPKGYDFENFLRRMTKDGFQAYKKNPNVPQRRMSRFRYNVQDAASRKIVRSRAPTTIFPQYNEEYTKNIESLQPFTRAYMDPEVHEPVVERGTNLESLRMYKLAQMKTLIPEDIIVLSAMKIEYRLESEFYAKDFSNLLNKISKDIRGIPYDD